MLATSITISSVLSGGSQLIYLRLGGLPPAWFLGLTETLWGNGHDIFFASLTRRAITSLGLALLVSVIAYTFSFRRSFVRIPEFADVGPLPRARRFWLPANFLDATILRAANRRARSHFVSRTLLRSDAPLQLALAFAALGFVLAAQ